MKNSKKKGFTLVELLVVIAIIAILATVSVVGYLSFTDKAKDSNDQSVVAQLNLALQADSVLDGEAKTMHDALQIVEEAGFVVEKFTPTNKDNHYLWNQEANKFVITDKDYKVLFPAEDKGNSTDYRFWKIIHKEADIASLNLSTYLADDFTEDGDKILNVKNGLDVGNISGIETINYNNTEAKTSTIRTNGGILNVNGPEDKVNHYGFAEKVIITEVAPHSYHEFGRVSFIDAFKGRIEIEASADINGIFANAESKAELTINIKASAKVKEVASEGTDFNITGSITIKTDIPKENIETTATMFAGGSGTKEDPYLITNREQLDNIKYNSYFYYDYKGIPIEQNKLSFSYYKIMDGVKEINCSNWKRTYLNGVLDGNGVSIIGLDNMLFDSVSNQSTDSPAIIKNITIENCNVKASNVGCALISSNDCTNLIIENVNISGYIEGQYASSYIGFGPGASIASNITFKNCVSTATLVAMVSGDDAIGGFIKHSYCKYDESKVTLIDSLFLGRVSTTGKDYHYLIGNPAYAVKTTITYSEQFLNKYNLTSPIGIIYNEPEEQQTNKGAGTYNYSGNAQGFIYIKENCTSKMNKNNFDITSEPLGSIIETSKIENAARAEASLIISPNGTNETGSYTSTFMQEKMILDGSTFKTKDIKKFNITINDADGQTAHGISLDGNTFNIKAEDKGTTHNGATIRVVQYDANGNILQITDYKLANPTTPA